MALAISALHLGCGAPGEPEPMLDLGARFGAQGTRALGLGRAPVALAHGFALGEIDAPAEQTPWKSDRLVIRLPEHGDEAIRIEAPGGFAMTVREVGSHGAASLVDRAVRYPREGGSAYWSATESGGEEWLHFGPGATESDRPAASWTIEGASPRRAGDVVELLDATGIPRVRVSAPAAYTIHGDPVPARLEVRGSSLDLYVASSGEEVLVDPSWTAATSMGVSRYEHTATLLPNGKVLVAGGRNETVESFTSAELYNPATNTWSPTGSMTSGRYQHTATLLQSGKVLVAGGAHANAEIYDPASNTWSPAGSLQSFRFYASATLLQSGKVLVAGGSFPASAVAELYDPGSNTWSQAASMPVPRFAHTATLLPSGKVLVAGGDDGSSLLSGAVLYDPSANTWSAAGSMGSAHYQHTATLLQSGKVLVAGGLSNSSADLYNPATNTWSFAGSLSQGHQLASATLLPSGQVLVAGGPGSAIADLYTPATNTWAPTASMNVARYSHTATALPNGKVLLSGGVSSNAATASVEAYAPDAAPPCTDGDGDGICDGADNCPAAYNPAQIDTNGDGIGNACQPVCVPLRRTDLGKFADATIDQGNPGAALGGDATLFVTNTAGVRQSTLFRFDLSFIPSTATVTESKLKVYQTNANYFHPNVKVWPVSGVWSEATVTWNSFASAFGPPMLVQFWGIVGYNTIDLTPISKSWVKGTAVNRGIIFTTDQSYPGTFASSEDPSPPRHPTATVCYACETPVPEICNGIDDDCDGKVDEDLGTITCGVGACAVTVPACVDGVPSVCNPHLSDGKPCDDGHVCTGADVCNNGMCTAPMRPAGTLCRGSAGACDPAEVCTGSAPDCPADQKSAPGTLCRGLAGNCDVAEVCDGSNNACPGDGFIAGGTPCRASAGVCDVAEACTGNSPSCPGDALSPAGTLCRASTGACDPGEVCSGAAVDCPPDVVMPSSIYYQDADGDGFGNPNISVLTCGQPPGWVPIGGDCDDSNAEINPGIGEICEDGLDNNCDGLIDDGCSGYQPCNSHACLSGQALYRETCHAPADIGCKPYTCKRVAGNGGDLSVCGFVDYNGCANADPSFCSSTFPSCPDPRDPPSCGSTTNTIRWAGEGARPNNGHCKSGWDQNSEGYRCRNGVIWGPP